MGVGAGRGRGVETCRLPPTSPASTLHALQHGTLYWRYDTWQQTAAAHIPRIPFVWHLAFLWHLAHGFWPHLVGVAGPSGQGHSQISGFHSGQGENSSPSPSPSQEDGLSSSAMPPACHATCHLPATCLPPLPLPFPSSFLPPGASQRRLFSGFSHEMEFDGVVGVVEGGRWSLSYLILMAFGDTGTVTCLCHSPPCPTPSSLLQPLASCAGRGWPAIAIVPSVAKETCLPCACGEVVGG